MICALALVLLAAPDLVELDVGTQKVVEIAPGSKLTVGDQAVVDAKQVSVNQLLLIGAGEGSTRVTATAPKGKSRSFEVTVRKMAPEKVVALLKAQLGIDAATIDVSGICPEIDCDSCTAAQLERIDQVLGLYPCVHSGPSSARPAQAVLDGARRILGEGDHDTPALVLDVRKGRVVLTGDVISAEDARRVELVRRAYPEIRVRVRAAQ